LFYTHQSVLKTAKKQVQAFYHLTVYENSKLVSLCQLILHSNLFNINAFQGFSLFGGL